MLYGYLILHFSCNQYLVDTGTIHIHNLELKFNQRSSRLYVGPRSSISRIKPLNRVIIVLVIQVFHIKNTPETHRKRTGPSTSQLPSSR